MGAYAMLEQVNGAIKKVKPEAILLDECGGPRVYSASDIGHNIGFIYQVVNRAVAKTDYRLADYKNLLSDVQDLYQDGALRVFYTRNHDTAWFYRFDGYSPEFFAYEAVHAFIRGIPLAFSGQFHRKGNFPSPYRGGNKWDGPNDEQFAFYRKLYTVRRDNRVFIDGECLYGAVYSNQRDVFSVVRTTDIEAVIVLVSASDKPISAQIEVDAVNLGIPETDAEYEDLWTGERGTLRDTRSFDISMEPFAVRLLKVVRV
jgi:hypothetical protein